MHTDLLATKPSVGGSSRRAAGPSLSVLLFLHAAASPQTWTRENAQAAKPLGEGEEAALLAVHATAFPARHRPCSLRGLTGSLHACMRRGGGLSARRRHAVSKGYGEGI